MRHKKQGSSLVFLSFAVAIIICGVAGKAAAASLERLSEAHIRAFIEKTATITSGNAGDMSEKAVLQYLEDHLHEDGRFKSSMTYNVPGYPPQQASIGLDKEEFIESVKKGQKSVSDYRNNVTIRNIKISGDGKNATVSTESVESGTMPVPTEDGSTQDVPIEGVATCSQTLMLSAQGVIQMYTAICQTNVTFQE